ncbi:RimK family alpha-L-glutamate ligase [Asaia bogorensis]|uniref:ATP-grasp domain-containing protein n=1 Tax=Asaia bogorensis TaxID=91915 RepID=UPI00197C797D|nr:hypothetical protein [Asaia bogorensis]
MNDGVLIFCDKSNSHGQTIATALRNIGAQSTLVDRDFDLDFSFSPQNSGDFFKLADSNRVILWMFKDNWPDDIDSNVTLERDFCRTEWMHALLGLQQLDRDTLWIDKKTNKDKASYKVYALKKALESGLLIPPSIVSNSYDEIENFTIAHDEVVYKTLSSPFIGNKIVYTSLMTRHDIDSFRNSCKIAPNLIQKYIKKKYELRLIWCLGSISAIGIDSQNYDHAVIDWRKESLRREMFFETTIPKDLVHKLNLFMRLIGLNYGVIDMIKTDEDDYIFLDINPTGQWDWIDALIGSNTAHNVANAIVEYLRQ